MILLQHFSRKKRLYLQKCMSFVDTVILNEIIEGCQNNEQSSQRRLYELYAKRMVAVCLRYTDDYEIARDLMHDGFIKVFHCITDYRGYGSFEGWLRRIFVNLSLDYIKKRIDRVEIEQVDYMSESEVRDFSLVQDIDTMAIYDAIKQLPEVARTIFNMFNIDGYSIKEIGEHLNMSSEAVRSQHSRAKEKLRQILTKN